MYRHRTTVVTVVNLRVQYSRLKEAVSEKDREISSLRRQLDATGEELTEAGRSREVVLRENRRLQDDLAIMTRENQVSVAAY